MIKAHPKTVSASVAGASSRADARRRDGTCGTAPRPRSGRPRAGPDRPVVDRFPTSVDAKESSHRAQVVERIRGRFLSAEKNIVCPQDALDHPRNPHDRLHHHLLGEEHGASANLGFTGLFSIAVCVILLLQAIDTTIEEIRFRGIRPPSRSQRRFFDRPNGSTTSKATGSANCRSRTAKDTSSSAGMRTSSLRSPSEEGDGLQGRTVLYAHISSSGIIRSATIRTTP
ncbi:MAG: hypothetical protein MZU97_12920 [Bacillus subtilis]|nr:hypothetical protein [Bacillus subtilis]